MSNLVFPQQFKPAAKVVNISEFERQRREAMRRRAEESRNAIKRMIKYWHQQ